MTQFRSPQSLCFCFRPSVLPRFLLLPLLTLFITFSALAGETFADTQEQRILVFGDSLSAAYGFNEEDGWVSLLQRKIDEEGLNADVINGSVSGETTDGGLARLPAMLASQQPDIVILELGGNDGLRGLPVEHIKRNLLEMVSLAEDAGATVILAGTQIPPNYGSRYTVPFFQQYQEIAESEELTLIPFLIEGIPQRPELMQSDGIHPRANAQHLILQNVWPALEPLLDAE